MLWFTWVPRVTSSKKLATRAPGEAMVFTFVEVAAVILSILKGVAPAVANDSGPEGAAPAYSRCSD